jgi:hypothetical protein
MSEVPSTLLTHIHMSVLNVGAQTGQRAAVQGTCGDQGGGLFVVCL